MPKGPIINFPKGIMDDISMIFSKDVAKYKTHILNNVLSLFPNSLKAGFGNEETVI